MYIATIPSATINAISDKLAIEIFRNWATVSASLAEELEVSEDHIQDTLDKHYQHILNNVYNALKKGGHISN